MYKRQAHGYYHLEEKRIAIDEGMSELQNLKTVIHEIEMCIRDSVRLVRSMRLSPAVLTSLLSGGAIPGMTPAPVLSGADIDDKEENEDEE